MSDKCPSQILGVHLILGLRKWLGARAFNRGRKALIKTSQGKIDLFS